jgi:uncharacterized protein (UPF0333 family)
MNETLKTALVKYANQDLAIARKKGNMGIVGTKGGATYISYDKSTKIYGIRNGSSVFEVNQDEAVQIVISLYNVVED